MQQRLWGFVTKQMAPANARLILRDSIVINAILDTTAIQHVLVSALCKVLLLGIIL